MKIVLFFIVFLTASLIGSDSFDDLLKSVKKESAFDLEKNAQREKAFYDANVKAKELLKKTQLEVKIAIEKSEFLSKSIDENEKSITTMEGELQRNIGDLGEVFGVIRQISGELDASFEHSIISLHYPKRREFLQKLAGSKELANIDELESLWYSMLQEMSESSKISKFTTSVIQKDGSYRNQDVIRIGSYGAVSENDFLIYSPTDNVLMQTQKQPSRRYLDSAGNFETSTDGMVKIMVDPTRGQLLSMLTQKPDWIERINQGGLIGYIILTLGIVGLSLAIARYVYLSILMRKIKKQSLNLSEPNDNNALGRIALVYHKILDKSQEQKEILLEEAILKEIPQFERYNPLIKLLAAVSPLLGLLGTVTGMIITFQSITLFGTSDPKLMAGGISTALITTVLGLSVAIPLLFAYTFIVAKSKRIIDLIEHQSIGLIAKEY